MEKNNKKLRLTKKQFIIGVLVVCGIALIIECALLVHTFSKGKGDKKKGNAGKAGTEKRAENAAEALSYTLTTYRYETGSRFSKRLKRSKRIVTEESFMSILFGLHR